MDRNKFIHTFAPRLRKYLQRILWKVAGVIERGGLEIRCTACPYRGFESLTFRQKRREIAPSLSAKNGVKLLKISGFTLFSATVVGQKRDSNFEAWSSVRGFLPKKKCPNVNLLALIKVQNL